MYYTIPVQYRNEFTNIPDRLFAYLDNLLENDIPNSSFHRAVIDHPEKTFKSINNHFGQACEITGLNNDSLLSALDFNVRDLCPTRIESIFGELRTIIILFTKDFNNIKPMRSNRGAALCDLEAEIYSKKCFVEVKTLIRFAARTFHESIVEWAMSKLGPGGAFRQLNVENSDCLNLFAMVLNSNGAVALNDREDYIQMLK